MGPLERMFWEFGRREQGKYGRSKGKNRRERAIVELEKKETSNIDISPNPSRT